MKYEIIQKNIEAKQFINYAEICDFCGEKIKGPIGVSFNLSSPSGIMKVNRNDYIIKDKQGHFYVCAPDIFEKLYKKVEKNNTLLERKFYCKVRKKIFPFKENENAHIIKASDMEIITKQNVLNNCLTIINNASKNGEFSCYICNDDNNRVITKDAISKLINNRYDIHYHKSNIIWIIKVDWSIGCSGKIFNSLRIDNKTNCVDIDEMFTY